MQSGELGGIEVVLEDLILVVAITQQGFGRVWRFADRQAALVHPLVQYGDAVFGDELELFDEYRLLELPSLMRRFELSDELITGVEARVVSLREQGYTDRRIRDALVTEQTARDVFQALERRGSEPPEDCDTVCTLVRGDREAVLSRGRNYVMAEAKEKKEKAPKEPKVVTIGGLDPKTKIKFGTSPDKVEKIAAVKEVKNKDGSIKTAAVPASERTVAGSPYHPEKNNPKRGKAGERFKGYKNGMTLQQAVDSGMTPADVAWDLKKGFIVAA